MKFLKTLLWVVIIALAVGLAARNWRDVTISLWGDLQADIKIPVLLLITFLLGFLPAWGSYRTRSWQLARRAPVAPAKPSLPENERNGPIG
jgi:hypothetical protein